MNSKGDIGFMEAMAAAMTVTLVLTAFVGAFSVHMTENPSKPPSLDTERFESYVYVSEGRLVGDISDELERQIERTGVKGAYVEFSPVSGYGGSLEVSGTLSFSAGEETGNVSTERRLVSVSGDGITVPVNMEVRIWA